MGSDTEEGAITMLTKIAYDEAYNLGTILALQDLGLTKEAGVFDFLKNMKNKRLLREAQKVMTREVPHSARTVAKKTVGKNVANVRSIQRMLAPRRGWRPSYA